MTVCEKALEKIIANGEQVDSAVIGALVYGGDWYRSPRIKNINKIIAIYDTMPVGVPMTITEIQRALGDRYSNQAITAWVRQMRCMRLVVREEIDVKLDEPKVFYLGSELKVITTKKQAVFTRVF